MRRAIWYLICCGWFFNAAWTGYQSWVQSDFVFALAAFACIDTGIRSFEDCNPITG